MQFKKTLNIRGRIFDLSGPVVMGILNLTPDSFYDGGTLSGEKQVLKRAEKHLSEGAMLLDVGGYSSRPGAKDVSEEEELTRVIGPILAIKREFPEAIVSLDTFRSRVAKEALSGGVDIINDISGGELDPDMFSVVGNFGCPYILMHMRGTPGEMTQKTYYEDILKELIVFFSSKINQLLRLGVKDIIVDPGFGFAKTIEQNYYLLKNLQVFGILEAPVLVGISRKSMIYKKLGISSQEALNGTSILNTIALLNGASILRVHDVKEAIEAIELYKLTYN